MDYKVASKINSHNNHTEKKKQEMDVMYYPHLIVADVRQARKAQLRKERMMHTQTPFPWTH